MEEIIDELSSAQERARRLKTCRDMTGLSRDAFDKRYGIPRGTIQNWETARFGGLTVKGARIIIKAFQAENIKVTAQWLLHGLGESPEFSQKLSQKINQRETLTEAQLTYDSNLITQELLFFRQNNPNSIDLVITDDAMTPVYQESDYVAGNRLYMDDIDLAIGQDCIVQTHEHGNIARILKPGSQPGRYNLYAHNSQSDFKRPVYYDVELLSAAPIVWVRRTHKTYTT